ncbi:hydantoinase/oxoprolinase family protein [Lentibacter algarum]|uniref:hydantoinase/oxoprolinase family protein n=1 Tax=Lentibacter algarum TaxID=576131 RepID=UPI001C08B5C6|nr:hydantoinase/oxoprolinase family protein [Lentibacter algarum]MBU2983681.1 hydantoinase/oxoprolinase family protein [Lentibacter algarum]
MSDKGGIKLSADIGGTFTDVVLETPQGIRATKVLTDYDAPERGLMEGVGIVLDQAGLTIKDVDLVIHGTTLATNTLIQRNGAKTALITTDGFVDVIEMAMENRFEQYDINIVKPKPLVDRTLRLPIPERMSAQGDVLMDIDEAAVAAVVPTLKAAGIESVAIMFLNAYANREHEDRAAAILSKLMPGMPISLSSDVAPEIREYERSCTTVANAYVRPMMESYLMRLKAALRDLGSTCPLLLMTSGGGLTTVETASLYPVRLVESGPAGGAILGAEIARECDLPSVLAYDMGGTTAKICFIDDGRPTTSRAFEVDRQYRFLKGSGMPIRIPVIEMVEIGAGGGSIAHIDELARVKVGPQSAGSEPGPACYDLGGTEPTVTDSNVIMGRIDPSNFAGGRMTLDASKSGSALDEKIGTALGLETPMAAFAVGEVVDENMANAARVHAIEIGKNIATCTIVATGGGAPLHATRMAEKLGIDRIIVPNNAGVGSAVGFLRAPVAYEVVRSRHVNLAHPNIAEINTMIEDMRAEATAVVEQGSFGAPLEAECFALMRYIGQGHELSVSFPARTLTEDDVADLAKSFDRQYEKNYSRSVPSVGTEALTWTMTVRTASTDSIRTAEDPTKSESVVPQSQGTREIFDADTGQFLTAQVYNRTELSAGQKIEGPAAIVEDQTTTILTKRFTAYTNDFGYLDIRRKTEGAAQ